MKGLSIKEPWASLILNGIKTVEIRPWTTSFRGEFIVCVSKTPTSELSGSAICKATLITIHPMSEKFITQACIDSLPKSDIKKMFKSHYAWILGNIKPLTPPIPIKGRLRFFNINL